MTYAHPKGHYKKGDHGRLHLKYRDFYYMLTLHIVITICDHYMPSPYNMAYSCTSVGCSSCKKNREPGACADATASKQNSGVESRLGRLRWGCKAGPTCHPQPKFVCGSGILYKSPPRLPPPSGGAGVARARWESPQGSSPGMQLCRAPTTVSARR
jgi:hypothetical protein